MKRRTSLATRIAALCLVVAAVAVLVAGLVAAPLVRTAARNTARHALVAQADVLATQLDASGRVSREGLGKAAEVVRGQGIALVFRPPAGVATGERDSVRAAVQAGLERLGGHQSVSATKVVAGQEFLVEMRAVDGGAFALVQPVRAAAPQLKLVRNIVIALAVGLLVAGLAGLILGRLLAKPLRMAASVTSSMSEGRRDLRVPLEGPAEVAEVATAVNELADALARSEARQREFLLSVSHELRTPLTAVHGFAESLADNVLTPDEAQRAGQTIQRESQRLERLVSDLLDLARLGADQFQLDMSEVDLVSTLRDCAEVWRVRCAHKDVEFRWEEPAYPVTALADARRLRQALDALADNALKVTPSHAPITLTLALRDGVAVFEVRDGGPGLAEEDYPVAFERGVLYAKYQGQRPVGSGVGLALAYGLVTRMGGTMQAGPAPEGGAAFSVLLPQVRHTL